MAHKNIRSGIPTRNAFQTVFILENSEAIWTLAPDVVDIDSMSKKPETAQFPLAPVQWTWLTWAIEGCFEYCRIGWDVVPEYKISIYGCGNGLEPIPVVPIVETNAPPVLKNPKLRDLRFRMIALGQQMPRAGLTRGFPNTGAVEKVFEKLHSLETEEMMSTAVYPSDLEAVSSSQPFYLRFVMVTSELDEQKNIALIRTCIMKQNLGYLARYEIAVIAIGEQAQKRQGASSEKVDEDIFISWYHPSTGSDIVNAMKTILTFDLRLSRTIVTGIPMKEDAKGKSTSFSFDVDLFHPCFFNDKIVQGRPGGSSLSLKWQRSVKGAIFSYASLEKVLPLRCTPSDPTTRPTQCLVGYVLDGNAVLLDSQEPIMACKLLLCGGKICIQQLTKAGADRATEEIPALSEQPGGRVGSYRVKELVALLSSFPLDQKNFPLKNIFAQHLRLTTYFPLVYSETIVYLLAQFVPLFDAINATNPKEANWAKAREAITEVVQSFRKVEPLTVPPSHVLLQHVTQSNKRAESYAVLWAELDMLLEENADKSEEHKRLWMFLATALKRPIRDDLKLMLREHLKCHMYNPAQASTVALMDGDVEVSKKRKTRPEFEGRLKYGRFGKLYQNLQKLDKNDRDGVLIHASLEL